MSFSVIRARIQTLSQDTSVADVRTFQTDVEEAWQRDTLAKLSVVFTNNTDESACLLLCDALLQTTWALIQNTSVSYTAMPDSALTHLLVDIGAWVADARNQTWRAALETQLMAHQAAWLALESDYLSKKSVCMDQVQDLLSRRWTQGEITCDFKFC